MVPPQQALYLLWKQLFLSTRRLILRDLTSYVSENHMLSGIFISLVVWCCTFNLTRNEFLPGCHLDLS